MVEMSANECESVQALIWQRELAIYQARGRGDLSEYAAGITPSYLSWPPHSPRPVNAEAFRKQAVAFKQTGAEQLEMFFTDFTLDGDSAIIYYQTHRTRLPNGMPADERFEVVHVWLNRDGDWQLFGGMARNAPPRSI